MTYFLWALPLLAVAALMVSGRASSVGAGLCGTLLAAAVALLAAPAAMTLPGLAEASVKGVWLAWLVGAVILAGLFFREIVSRDAGDEAVPEDIPGWLRRRRAFAACFLIGPFAEAATGFGVGQVATIAILLRLGIAPLHVVLLGLFSQILVSWGAMANGTMVGAEFAGITPHEIGIHSALVSIPLLLGWLALFWRMAPAAGLEAGVRHWLVELGWVLAGLALLVLANHQFGPEIAGMAALGPLILVQFWRDERPDRARWRSLIPIGVPYAALILCVAATRAIPALNTMLRETLAIQPFADAMPWHPLLHPGSWLFAIGLLTAVLAGRTGEIPLALKRTVSRGWPAVLTIGIYLVMARIMADSGTAGALAGGLALLLGPSAVLATPWLAGAFGFLTGSSNAANGLLMTSQAGLAADGRLPLLWVAAIQNTAAAALTMLSPARVSMGCALVGRKDLEPAVYAQAWHLGAAPLLILTGVALALLWV